MFKLPESNARFGWTRHIKNKMVYYNISQAQVMRIFRLPKRREEGIAPGTVAAMRAKKGSGKTKDSEIWIMYTAHSKQEIKNKERKIKHKLSVAGYNRPQISKIVMISAWRYPGVTKAGERPPIPEAFIDELAREGVL